MDGVYNATMIQYLPYPFHSAFSSSFNKSTRFIFHHILIQLWPQELKTSMQAEALPVSKRVFDCVTIHDSQIKLDQWGSSGNRELYLVQRTIVMLVGIIAASHVHCKFLMEASSTWSALYSKALALKIPWGSLVSTTLPKLEQAISTSNLELANSS